MKDWLIGLGLSIIMFCILIIVVLLIVSQMDIDLNKACNDQFKDCLKNNGTLSFVECNCKPYFFSSDDCKECYKSSGQFCTYPNNSYIKCEITLIN